MIGTPLEIGFYINSATPDIDERTFKDGVPYADQADVFATLAVISRARYLPVNIAGVEYWFNPDIYTLVVKNSATAPDAVDIPIADAAAIYDSTNVEDALAEVMGSVDALAIEVAALVIPGKNPFQILLPVGDLTTKIAGATFLPAGWATIAQSGDYDAVITHTLTGRKVSFINVFKTDGGYDVWLSPDKGMAYSGFKGNDVTVVISGIAHTSLAVRIELIFD